jgi:pyridoxine 5'-phosphate synthase PdxJ
VARAIFVGMREAVREMKRLLDRATARIAIIDSEPE